MPELLRDMLGLRLTLENDRYDVGCYLHIHISVLEVFLSVVYT